MMRKLFLKITKIIDPMKSIKSSIQVFKYSSIEFTNWLLHIIIIIITYNVKTRDPIGSNK